MESNKTFGIIYKATNTVNGKVYIGQTIVGLRKRRLSHINDSIANRDNIYFHNSIRKYGPEKFIWEELEADLPWEELDDMEYHYIKQYSSKYPNGYNLTEGGGGMKGYVITESHRKNLSESHKGYVHTEEQRRKISESLKGRICSEKTRRIMSQKNSGENHPMYGRKGKSSHSYGITPPKHVFEALIKKVSKDYVITFPDGHEELITNLSEFCRSNNLNKGNMCSVAHGRRAHYKGYKCRKSCI